MNISKNVIDGVTFIVIEENEADLSNSETFKKMVAEEIENGERRIGISFKNVEYVDSSFLGALVAILKLLLPLSGKLVLFDMNNDIINLFQLTKLDQIFKLKTSAEEALKELNG